MLRNNKERKMEVKVLSQRQLFQSKKNIGLLEEEIELPGGVRSVHHTVTHRGAVVILPVTEEGKLLFLRQYRHSLKETIWELPAGTLDPKEGPDACAAREIQEETGFAAAEWHSLGTLWPAPGFCDEVQYCYLAKKLTPSRRPMDEDEVIEVCPLSVEETLSMIAEGTIRDGKSLAVILKARCLGLV